MNVENLEWFHLYEMSTETESRLVVAEDKGWGVGDGE